jgi:hypothetical protein
MFISKLWMFKVAIVWVYRPTSLNKSVLMTYKTEVMWLMNLGD